MQTETVEAAKTLQPLGWILLICSVSFVTILVVWCFRKVLSLPPAESDSVKDLHSA